MSEFFFSLDLWVIAATMTLLIAGSVILGYWVGRRAPRMPQGATNIGILTGGALGMIGLLIAVSFSVALAGYNVRRAMAVEEATALASSAYNALLLPQPQKAAVLPLLRQYADVRSRMGVPYDPARIPYDEQQSLTLLSEIWKLAVAATAADHQSPAIQGFVVSLDHLSAVHEERAAELHNHVPLVVITMLIAASMATLGFTAFQAGLAGGQPTGALIMGLTLAIGIVLVIDLDKPGRGSFQAQREALDNARRDLTSLAATP